MSQNYKIVTYGCQMNVHESEKIAGILVSLGYAPCETEENADIIVFNTCCIRENAENHAFGNIGALKKLKKQNPGLIVAVGGCMMQESDMPEELHRKFPFVDIIFGTHNLSELASLIEKKRRQKKVLIDIREKEGSIVEGETPHRTSYPNAWVNINYGCNNFCTYCIVPYVRGRERSRRPEFILDEVEKLLAEGYKEITLLGQNVNSYGNDFEGGLSFPELLKKAASFGGKYRVRFMTSHPKDFTRSLAEVIASCDNVCHLVHLPVQSGSDRILKAMNRRYTVGQYLEKVKILKETVPDCELTSDLIVGFPGETEEDFEATMRLVKEVNYASAFTFVYSKRRGTKAAEMEDQVPEEVQKERIMHLVELVNAQTREKSANYIGKQIEILCEDYDAKRGYYLGRDEYGRMGYFKSERDRIGEFVTLRVDEASGVSLFGTAEER